MIDKIDNADVIVIGGGLARAKNGEKKERRGIYSSMVCPNPKQM
jgi:hypothetical protein